MQQISLFSLADTFTHLCKFNKILIWLSHILMVWFMRPIWISRWICRRYAGHCCLHVTQKSFDVVWCRFLCEDCVCLFTSALLAVNYTTEGPAAVQPLQVSLSSLSNWWWAAAATKRQENKRNKVNNWLVQEACFGKVKKESFVRNWKNWFKHKSEGLQGGNFFLHLGGTLTNH